MKITHRVAGSKCKRVSEHLYSHAVVGNLDLASFCKQEFDAEVRRATWRFEYLTKIAAANVGDVVEYTKVTTALHADAKTTTSRHESAEAYAQACAELVVLKIRGERADGEIIAVSWHKTLPAAQKAAATIAKRAGRKYVSDPTLVQIRVVKTVV